jgi:cytochrome c553
MRLLLTALTLVAACSTPNGDAGMASPYATPVVCTSMTNWTGGNSESVFMRPGAACIACHQQEGKGPRFAVAGTLFPTPHEPDDCYGVAPESAAGAQVEITDANGMLHTLKPNGAGNFYLESSSFSYPYTAKVTYQGRERAMLVAQTTGDCNSCHTQDGTQSAPGRIFLP